MADKLQILIDTSFAVNTENLRATLNQIQKNTGLKINFDSSALNGVQTKLTEVKNSAGEVTKRISESVNAFGTVTTKVEELNKSTGEWSTKIKEVTNTEKLLSEEIKRQQSIKTQRDSQDRAYWDAKRQHTLEQLTATSQESQAQRAYYTELEKTTAEQARLNEEKKKATQFSKEKEIAEYYKVAEEYMRKYKNGLMDAVEVQQRLGQMIGVGQSKNFWKFDGLDKSQQDKMYSAYNSATLEAQNKAYSELNRLLIEEYNLRMRIEKAKLSRYEAKDNKNEEEKVTVLERELQKRLELNQAQKQAVNTSIVDNRIGNQERLNQLVERENQLKSELAIRTAQVASSQQMLTAKTQNDLDNFTKGMNVNLDGLARKYDYVGGASKKIEAFRQQLAGVTTENNKLYTSTTQADGSIQKSQTTIQQLRMQYRQLRNEIQGSINFIDKIKNNILKFGSWMIGGSILMQAVRGIKSAITSVNELSDAITTLRRVSNGTEAEYQSLGNAMFNVADRIGGSAKNLVDSMAEFSKLGYSFSQAQTLAEQASKYASAGQLSIDESTKSLISTYQVFNGQLDENIGKIITATEITDLFNETGNRMSATAGQVGDALQRSANALSLANNSLSESVALIASGNKTIQNSEVVGTALKSISMRLRGVSEDGEELDAKLGDTIANITGKYGDAVQIFDKSTNSFKSTYDILLEISKVWKSMEDADQALLLEKMAGKQRAEVLGAILNNAGDLTKALQVASESVGSVDKEMDVIMNTTTKKIEQMKNAFAELANATYDADITKFFVDSTTSILQFITSLGGLVPVLTLVTTTMAIVKREVVALMAINSYAKLQTLTGAIVSFILRGNMLSRTVESIKLAFLKAQASIVNYNNDLSKGINNIKTLAPAINLATVGVGALIGVFTLVSIAISKAKQKHDEIIQSYKEQVSSTEELVSKIDDLKTQYEELSKTKNRSEEQNKQLLNIQKQLNEVLGLENGALDASNQTWEERISLIDKATKKELEYAVTKQKDVVSDEKDKYNKASKNGKYDDDYLIYDKTGFGSGFNLNENKAFEELKNQLKDVYGELLIEDNNGSIYFDKTKMSAEELNEALEYTHTLMQNKDGLNKSKYEEFSTAVGKTANAYKSLTEAQEKQYQMQAKANMFDLGKTESDIENMTKEETEAFKKSFAEISKGQNPEYIQYFYDMVDAIQAEKEAIDKLNGAQETTVDSLSMLKSALSSINTDSLLSENADLLADSLKTLQDGGKLTYEQFSKLIDLFPNLSTLFAECGDSAVDFGGALDYVRGMVDDYGSDMDDLNSAIEKVSKGQSLSDDEIINLTRKYPQLQAKIDETTGLYYIELDALKKTKEQTTTTAKGQIKNEIDKTKVTLENTKKRIEAYLQERIELQKLSNDGYTLYSDALKGVKFNEDGSVEDSGALTYLMSQDSKLREEFEKYSESQKRILDLQKEYDNLDIIGQEGSSEKKNKDKSYIEEGFQDRLDLIKAMREELVNEISKLQSQIEIATSKHGDASPYVQKLRDQLNKLKEDEANLIKSSAEELRKLRDDYFKRLTNGNSLFEGLTAETFSETDLAKASRQMEKTIAGLGDSEKANGLELNKSRIEEMGEAILSISEELSTLGDDFYSNKQEKLDEYISRIQDAISYEEELYSDKDNEAQLRFSILDETDDGYIDTVIAIQQDLIDTKIKLQETYKSKYESLLKQGLSAESSVMRELKTKWNDTNKEIFDMRKEMNEKYISYVNSKSSSVTASRDKVVDMLRKQDDLQKDIYDKQKDAIKEKADADKKALENRKKELDTIKSEYDYQNKIADLRRALSDTLSDLNALEFDDSADAIQAKVELANQLQDDKQALADEEFNRAIEMAQEAIDKAIEAIENQTNAQTEAIDRLIDALSNKTDREYATQAGNMLLNDEEGTYNKLLEYNREWGDGIDNTITSLFDSAKPVLEEIRNANIGIQEALNNFANLAYSKQLENTSNGAMTFDNKSITGNGQIVSPDMISKSLNNVVIPVFDGLKNVLATFNQTPKAITVSPQFSLNVEGNADAKTVSAIKSLIYNDLPNLVEKTIETNIWTKTRNIVGAVK